MRLCPFYFNDLKVEIGVRKAVTILANVAAVHPEMGNIEKLAAQLLQE